MATYKEQTVDLLWDMETYPPTGTSEVDTNNRISQSATAKYDDTYGMLYDNTSSQVAYLTHALAASKNNFSIGFWYYTPLVTAGGWNGDNVIFVGRNDGDGECVRIYQGRFAGDDSYMVRVRTDSGFTTNIGLSEQTWYWFTLQYNDNGTTYMQVYNTSETQVGSEISVATGNLAAVEDFDLGLITIQDIDGPAYFDSFVCDYTDATYPLLGWQVGGGGLSIPVAMHHYQQMRMG